MVELRTGEKLNLGYGGWEGDGDLPDSCGLVESTKLWAIICILSETVCILDNEKFTIQQKKQLTFLNYVKTQLSKLSSLSFSAILELASHLGST